MQSSFFPTSTAAPVFPSFSRSLSKRKLDETYTEEEDAQMVSMGDCRGPSDASEGQHVQKQIRPLPNLSFAASPFDPALSSTSSPASSAHFPDTPSYETAPSWSVHHQYSSLSTSAAARTQEENERGIHYGDDEVDEEDMAMFVAMWKGKGAAAPPVQEGEDSMMGGPSVGGMREHGPSCTSPPSIVLSNPNPSGERSLWSICRDCGHTAPA